MTRLTLYVLAIFGNVILEAFGALNALHPETDLAQFSLARPGFKRYDQLSIFRELRIGSQRITDSVSVAHIRQRRTIYVVRLQ